MLKASSEKPFGSSTTSPRATAAPSDMDTDSTYKNGYSVTAMASSTNTHMRMSRALSPGLWLQKELGLETRAALTVMLSSLMSIVVL